jgi:hypothetical protein
MQCAATRTSLLQTALGGLRGDLSRLSRLSRTILRTLPQGGGKYRFTAPVLVGQKPKTATRIDGQFVDPESAGKEAEIEARLNAGV